MAFRIDRTTGLVSSLKPKGCGEALAGPLLEPLVIEDTADSWGTGHGRYRKIVGRFRTVCPPCIIEKGPVRTVTRSVLAFRKSRVVMDVVSYPFWPVLEFRFRVTWNEERRRLKLRVPTRFQAAGIFCEIPGGAIRRPADGEEHVHGRWLVVEGTFGKKSAAIGVASSGQHGLDFHDGELRLSVLRSSAYCHERGFDLGAAAPALGTRTRGTCPPAWKFTDIGVHEFRILVTAGRPAAVKSMMPGLADHVAAPPAAYAHLPYDAGKSPSLEPLISLKPASVRLLACKRSWDGEALIIRLQEAVGRRTKAELRVSLRDAERREAVLPQPKAISQERGHVPEVHVPPSAPIRVPRPAGGRSNVSIGMSAPLLVPLNFRPFEIKTARIESDGTWSEVRMIEER